MKNTFIITQYPPTHPALCGVNYVNIGDNSTSAFAYNPTDAQLIKLQSVFKIPNKPALNIPVCDRVRDLINYEHGSDEILLVVAEKSPK